MKQRRLTIILLLIHLLLTGVDTYGQSTARLFHRLNIFHPEAPTFVTAIIQDQMGFIWLGTTDGLYRFDGYQFRAFRHNPADSTSIRKNNITCLHLDDQGHIWVGAVGAVQRLDPETFIFEEPELGPEFLLQLPQNSITQILQTRKTGQIWIATDRSGLLRYDPALRQTRFFQHFAGDADPTARSTISGIAEDPAGVLWVAASNGVYYYEPEGESFSPIPFEPPARDQKGNILTKTIKSLAADSPGGLWVAMDGGGLYRRHADTGEWTAHHHDQEDPRSLSDNRLTLVYPDRRGQIWGASVSGGLNRYDAERNSFVRYQNAAAAINSISDDHVYAVFEDRNGLLWVGTAAGVDILRPRNAQFEFFQREPQKPSTLSDDKILSLLEDRQGDVWIGTRGGGLNRYNPRTQTYTTYRRRASDGGSLANDMVWSIHQDQQDRLWIGTSGDVLHLLDPSSGRFTRIALPVTNRQSNVFSNQIRSITEDEHGILWLATLGSGLFAFDPETGSLEAFRLEEGNEHSLSSNDVFAVAADQKGGVWVATIHGGICYFDLSKRSFTRYAQGDKDPRNQGYADNFALFIDRRQRVWVGTANARLGVFDPQADHFRYFLEDKPDVSYVIMGIVDDEAGNLWLTTNRGLLQFTPPDDLYASEAQGTIRRYTVQDGLQDNDFNTGAIFQSGSGHLYVGGPKGYNRFHPDSLIAPDTEAEVVLTDFQIFNQSVPIIPNGDRSSKAFSLDRDIAFQDQIVLAHRQRVFSFEFTALDLDPSGKKRYAYRMEGFNPDWTDIGSQRSLTFTSLSPGNYTLQLRAGNANGAWSSRIRSLQIVITPPWYQSWWAYVIFTSLLFAGLLFVYRFNLQRVEARQLKELDGLKTRLYTNITHEFRTPLTVILGVSENIRGHEQEKKMIRRNGKNLLRLIQQLLDLSKLEAGKLKLDLIQADIVVYLQYLTESFYSMAGEKEIRLTFYSEADGIVMDYDEEKIQQILYNLLSNAIKFTPTTGKVILHLLTTNHNGQPHLKIKVKDTGIGIPPEKHALIFDRFYQVDDTSTRQGEGAGIGLALTKELVNLMKGTISVESTLGKGTEFTIWLPITHEAPVLKEQEQERRGDELFRPEAAGLQVSVPDLLPGADQPILLIIEDNPDVVTYIQSLLKKDYHIHTARNGQQGIDRAVELIPDIIISDVMMPEKNGYEVCNALKGDERTSHIPIILLTAKATQEDRVQGLKYGADAFLTKPFHKEELLIRLEKLVGLRRALQERYSGGELYRPSDHPSESAVSLEDAFLRKLQGLIQEHIDEVDFGVAGLARRVSMSQMQLYRKLKALTEKTPSQYIRSIRLQKGKELLQTTDLTISEIAYQVGFSDPNYFTRTFLQEFKTTPSDFRK